MKPLLSIAEAKARMRTRAASFTQTPMPCPVEAACGLVLADDVHAPINQPPFAASAMDGVALRAADAQDTLPISTTIYAGQSEHTLSPHTSARIFTGAPLPAGADTVVPQENCLLTSQEVCFTAPVVQGSFVRPAGSDIAQGALVMPKHTQLTPIHLATCSALGIVKLMVHRPLSVCLLTTGDEIIQPPTPLRSGQIYNSNATLLKQLLSHWGCKVAHQHIGDQQAQITSACQDALDTHDLVITIGGVSVGNADYIQKVAQKCATVDFWGVALRPGKPFLFAHTKSAFLCGVPGNPVSALVTACIFILPLIRQLQLQADTAPTMHRSQADFTTHNLSNRDEFRRVRRLTKDGHTRLTDLPQQESHMLSGCLAANALAYIPAGHKVDKGTMLEYLLLADFLS